MITLGHDLVDFLAAGVVHQVGACADGWPSICRGLAAQVEPDGRLAVVLSAESGFEVLDAIRATRLVSLVVGLPQTFRTLHFKGRDAEVAPVEGEPWRALIAARQRALDAQLAPYGFPPELTRAWYTVPEGALACVRFAPVGVWNQTPGPGAGSPAELSA